MASGWEVNEWLLERASSGLLILSLGVYECMVTFVPWHCEPRQWPGRHSRACACRWLPPQDEGVDVVIYLPQSPAYSSMSLLASRPSNHATTPPAYRPHPRVQDTNGTLTHIIGTMYSQQARILPVTSGELREVPHLDSRYLLPTVFHVTQPSGTDGAWAGLLGLGSSLVGSEPLPPSLPSACRLALGLCVGRALESFPLLASISPKYHLGRKPTLSSPASTSRTPMSSNRVTLTPSFGLKTTRHTGGLSAMQFTQRPPADDWWAPPDGSDCVACAFPPAARTMDLRNAMNRCPQSKQTVGSQAPRLPRTRRGMCIVLNDWSVFSRPAGVRNPTTISWKTSYLR